MLELAGDRLLALSTLAVVSMFCYLREHVAASSRRLLQSSHGAMSTVINLPLYLDSLGEGLAEVPPTMSSIRGHHRFQQFDL